MEWPQNVCEIPENVRVHFAVWDSIIHQIPKCCIWYQKKKKKIKNQSLIGENICKEYTLIRVSYTLEFFIEFFEIQQQKGK